jgi:bacterioferritin-associated ferredoxin
MPLVVRAVDRVDKTATVHIANNERCGACGSTLGPIYSLKRR